ncbi:M14 family metallopeptidase [Streptomyces tropicalis]|uniref:M14 family metallopeptidase n=1 Tax=Streptomyces tropicalis TaxID=3034234 RepID=A0ABT6A0I4_9ACTN|nr:M14 family metallopeptidase [Streptomyces tropicalis]MDF3298150.1 M14 family metallopeptidase [Streptomyces tropicalis]
MRPRPRGAGARTRRVTLLAALGALTLAAPLTATAPAAAGGARPGGPAAGEIGRYEIHRTATPATRAALRRTGVTVDEADRESVVVSGRPGQIRSLRARGYDVTALGALPDRGAGTRAARPHDFPAADAKYHTYAEMNAEIARRLAAHPGILSRRVIGKSAEGRDIVALKVSDHVATDENEPEVLLTFHQHAREHLTVEMALYLLRELVDGYGTDPRITRIVDSREIWILPDLNPDGGAYDIATGSYRSWRKNRQPNSGSPYPGTDLNRNWGFHWGCCQGSSGSPSAETYRGSAPESAPEVKAVADFARSRVVGGRQQIRAGIDFHSYSELVMWPFGFTTSATAAGMTADDAAAFRAVGRRMAASNGYTPEQTSDLYVSDGSIDDYLWGTQRIFDFTFEMYPRSAAGGGFYPPGEVIERETARNRDAVLQLLETADCVYRAIGKEAQYCAPAPAHRS